MEGREDGRMDGGEKGGEQSTRCEARGDWDRIWLPLESYREKV